MSSPTRIDRERAADMASTRSFPADVARWVEGGGDAPVVSTGMTIGRLAAAFAAVRAEARKAAIEECAATMDSEIADLKTALGHIETLEKSEKIGFAGGIVKRGKLPEGNRIRGYLADAEARQRTIRALAGR